MPVTIRLLGRWSHKRFKALVWAFLVLACCPALPAQSGGFLTTTAASGLQAVAVTADHMGNIYVGVPFRVWKVSPSGKITAFAGTGNWSDSASNGDGGQATNAQLRWPYELAVDGSGNVYILDEGDYQGYGDDVRKVTPDGTITSVATATAFAPFSPTALAVDQIGNLYIACATNSQNTTNSAGRVLKLTPTGVLTSVAGNGSSGFSGDGGPATMAQMRAPSSIAFDGSGSLYIADEGNSDIRRVTLSQVITSVPIPTLYSPANIAADRTGNLYFSDAVSNEIIQVAANGVIGVVAGGGVQGLIGDGGPATAVGLSPTSIYADPQNPQGNVYVADRDGEVRNLIPSAAVNGCVYSIDATTQSFGTSGGTQTVGVLTSGPGCPWLAGSYVDWVEVTPSSIGTGNGIVTYSVVPNVSSKARTGTLWIAGQTLAISQSGVVCAFSVTPRAVSVPPAGLIGNTFTVNADASDCGWTTSTSASWILVSGGTTGTGSGTVTFTVGVNTGTLRTGTITVAGQKVYVNQAAAGESVSSLASLNVGGIVNAASGLPPISSGGFVTVYGQNLADTTSDWSAAITNGKLPTSLGGVQVLINGKNAYISYVQPTQVNAIAQPDMAAGSIEVDVITNHGTVPALVNMVPISPALFTYSLQGTLYADGLFNSDGEYVAAVGAIPGVTSRPAQAGDFILLFATGLGPTNPPYPVGQVFTTAYPVPDLSQVSVLIGGQPAPVLFAGMTYAGVFQINIQMPSGVPAGNQPVVLQVSGQASLSTVYLTFGGG